MNGYAGEILRIDLTRRKIMTIPTRQYESFHGGHGMGSAIFFDLVKDKTIDGFHPDNVCTLMTSPLCGTLAPSASGRTEVQGIGVQSSPIGWFTRSNFGGRFSPTLKYAGWDGIVLEGKADQPVWIDIRNGEVQIRNCAPLSLWGKDTWECQKAIWNDVAESGKYGDWIGPDKTGKKGRSTQRPAVVAIGQAGENLDRIACLIHDAGNGSGQGGFGAVWGSKNLKAISVMGTGSIKIHDPKALMQTRMWIKENYAYNPDDIKCTSPAMKFHAPPMPAGSLRPKTGHRPQACTGCIAGCRGRTKTGFGNETNCRTARFYATEAKTPDIAHQARDLINRYGINAYEVVGGLLYVLDLHQMGVLGRGKAIDCPLDFEDLGSLDFVEQFVKMIAYRNDGLGKAHPFGDALAEGFFRAAERWGRQEEDLKTGLLQYPYWGLPEHGYDPRVEMEWGYGSILGDREVNEHDFNSLFFDYIFSHYSKRPLPLPVEEAIKIYTDKMVPYEGDMLMLDYSTENMYSEHIAKMVAWQRHYSRFWKQSLLFCDWRWPDFLNHYGPGKKGLTPEGEPRLLKAVTGKDISFAEGMEVGRKVWNLDQAIWTLQGRHRDMVHYADYIYSVPFKPGKINYGMKEYYLPGKKDGKWDYIDVSGRYLDRQGMDEFKTRFYKLEGWDPETGYPTRETLNALGLDYVAKELEENGKLGKV